jgi:hypothetical protein
MNKYRLLVRRDWRLMILLLVSVGLMLSACSPAVSGPTPTPTKTPRPAHPATLPPGPAVTPPAEPSVEAPSATDTVAPAAPPTESPAASATIESSPTTAAATATKPAPTAAPVRTGGSMSSPDYGMQAFLWWRDEVADRDLQLLQDAGFSWVKQYFAWQDIEGAGKGQFDWSRTDRIIDQVGKYGFKLLVRVSQDPDKPFWAGNPPENSQQFADFLAALAKRYKGRIGAYQIWNEPNLAREWGNKQPDPAGYTKMLRSAYNAIKTNDPSATVVTAGMAPTTQDDAIAMPDLKFYQGMYDAMNKNSDGYFDMLGVHGAGYAVAPETDPQVVATDPKLNNNDPSPTELKRVYAFRHIEDVRNVMVQNGDSDKRVVVLEFGWTTDPRPESPYYWHGKGAGIDQAVQGDYLVRAYKWAAEHWQPWVALMSGIYMPDVNWTKQDEQYYWSIMKPDYPDYGWRAAYIDLCIYLNGLNGERCKWDPNQ